MLYPEVVGRELKVENLIAKNMQKFLQRVESNIQMAKMTKCKIGMRYNATCPVIVNSFLKCKWSDIDDTGNFCFQCSAIKLLEDLEERCNVIMNDKPMQDGKFSKLLKQTIMIFIKTSTMQTAFIWMSAKGKRESSQF